MSASFDPCPDPRPSIVLIGPSGTGKSTVAPLLAARLGWRWVDLDDLRTQYYPEFGHDPLRAMVEYGVGHVVLVLPAADADTAMSILGSRIRQAAIGVPARILDAFDEHNREYFEHSANRQLATVTVITGTRDPAATADLIAERLAVRPT